MNQFYGILLLSHALINTKFLIGKRDFFQAVFFLLERRIEAVCFHLVALWWILFHKLFIIFCIIIDTVWEVVPADCEPCEQNHCRESIQGHTHNCHQHPGLLWLWKFSNKWVSHCMRDVIWRLTGKWYTSLEITWSL